MGGRIYLRTRYPKRSERHVAIQLWAIDDARVWGNAMSWTETTTQAETWTAETPSLHIFSTLVFSHDFFGGSRVFALGSSDGNAEVWDSVTSQAESWTAA